MRYRCTSLSSVPDCHPGSLIVVCFGRGVVCAVYTTSGDVAPTSLYTGPILTLGDRALVDQLGNGDLGSRAQRTLPTTQSNNRATKNAEGDSQSPQCLWRFKLRRTLRETRMSSVDDP